MSYDKTSNEVSQKASVTIMAKMLSPLQDEAPFSTFDGYYRFLQEVDECLAPSIAPSQAPSQVSLNSQTSHVLRNTFEVYGIIFLVLFLIFCFVRRLFPRLYNIRNTYEHMKCELAENSFGFVSWVWGVFLIPQEKIFNQCGLDAVALIRILEFGIKLALVGVFNSFFLIPTYKTEDSKVTANIIDTVQQVSLAHVAPNSPRMYGTVIAAYILFGSAMYLIIQEFKWYTEHRHRFLVKTQPNNYAIYVNGIPPQYQSNKTLQRYFNDLLSQDVKVEKSREKMFRNSFVDDVVLEAGVALSIPKLEKLVNERDALNAKLKHAINIRDIKGKTPMHKTRIFGGEKVYSIEYYAKEIEGKKQEIEEALAALAKRQHDTHARIMKETGVDVREPEASNATVSNENGGNIKHIHSNVVEDVYNDIEASISQETGDKNGIGDPLEPPEQAINAGDHGNILFSVGKKGFSTLKDSANKVKDTATTTVGDAGKKGIGTLKDSATMVTDTANTLIGGKEDGDPRIAGFVSFRTLRSTAAAVQMLHHEDTFEMFTEEAPLPEDILWGNVGKSNKSIQIGNLISFALTAVLCIFWTIPVAFVAGIKDVESLTEILPFLAGWIEAAPWLVPVLAQIAPLLVVVLVAMLPTILLIFTSFEGLISDSAQQASLFVKLASFMIIQTFFISAISGTIWTALEDIIEAPLSVVNLLGEALPQQSAYFMQISLVQTFIGVGTEILLVSPIAIALVRSKVGPNLTEEERNTTWLGLRPLYDAKPFDYARIMYRFVLYFMIVLVYSCISPIVPYVELLCFGLLTMCYRNNLVYHYPFKDYGGQIWVGFISVMVWALIIAEIVLVGALVLKRSSIATPFLLPLVFITILFKIYIGKQHYFVAAHLPGRKCIEADGETENFDFSTFKRAYIQSALFANDATKSANNRAIEDEFHDASEQM